VTTEATELCRRADVDAFYLQTTVVEQKLDAPQSGAIAMN
jgi:hypothetical protein